MQAKRGASSRDPGALEWIGLSHTLNQALLPEFNCVTNVDFLIHTPPSSFFLSSFFFFLSFYATGGKLIIFYIFPKNKTLLLKTIHTYPFLSAPPPNSRSFFPTRAAQNLPKHSSRAQPAHSLACSFRTRLHSLSADLLNIKDSFIPESLCGQLAVKSTGCLVRGSVELPTITGRLPADSKSIQLHFRRRGRPPTPYVPLIFFILILWIHSSSSLLFTDLYTRPTTTILRPSISCVSLVFLPARSRQAPTSSQKANIPPSYSNTLVLIHTGRVCIKWLSVTNV